MFSFIVLLRQGYRGQYLDHCLQLVEEMPHPLFHQDLHNQDILAIHQAMGMEVVTAVPTALEEECIAVHTVECMVGAMDPVCTVMGDMA